MPRDVRRVDCNINIVDKSVDKFVENKMRTEKVKLESGIKLSSGDVVEEVVLTEPKIAMLKGISRLSLLTMDDDAHKKLLPRISEPLITAQMFDELSLYDSQQLMTAISSFFTVPLSAATTAA